MIPKVFEARIFYLDQTDELVSIEHRQGYWLMLRLEEVAGRYHTQWHWRHWLWFSTYEEAYAHIRYQQPNVLLEELL